jgi:hypothetical protein
MLGMTAFAVDIGWIVSTKADLNNAADAASLAGVKPLMDGYVQYCLATTSAQQTSIMNTAMANARTYAKTYAGYNSAGGVSSLTLLDSDIEFGFTDGTGKYTPLSGTAPYPNTIKVTMRRDSSANGPLPLSFGRVLGVSSSNVVVSAAATMYGGTVDNLASNPTGAVYMMPVTYDVNYWNSFLATGLDPDGNLTTYNSAPALVVYPSVKAPGNFGQLSLDDNHVGDSTEVGWVNNGVSASDIQALQSANLMPLSSHDPTKWNWQGDTGLKASLISAINAKAGQKFMLPLFKPYNSGVPTPLDYSAGTGQGSNYYYQIVQFVAVTVVPSNGTVVVQPTVMLNPNFTFTGGNPVPIGTGSATGLVTTFSAPKLTQ